ncbi:MAG: hypothetical protein AAGK01_09535 [Pseudomonadota bacterium]
MLASASLALAVTTPAFADDSSVTEAASEQKVKLDLANQILAISYPEETREPMFRAVAEQMEAQMLQSLREQLQDDEALAIIEAWQQETLAETNAVLKQAIPDLMDSWAMSFSKIYTEQELRDILAFVSTDSGRSFMLKSTQVVSHPDFAAANQRYIDKTLAIVMDRMPDLMNSIVEYRAATSEN